MRWRALGQAITWDLIGYLSKRGKREAKGADLKKEHLAEALSLYVVPQFDALERDNILGDLRPAQRGIWGKGHGQQADGPYSRNCSPMSAMMIGRPGPGRRTDEHYHRPAVGTRLGGRRTG